MPESGSTVTSVHTRGGNKTHLNWCQHCSRWTFYYSFILFLLLLLDIIVSGQVSAKVTLNLIIREANCVPKMAVGVFREATFVAREI
jgi:hypothetical protein